MAQNGRLAPGRFHQAAQHPEGRALARTVRADQAEHLPPPDLEIQVRYRLDGVEGLGEMPSLDYVVRRGQG